MERPWCVETPAVPAENYRGSAEVGTFRPSKTVHAATCPWVKRDMGILLAVTAVVAVGLWWHARSQELFVLSIRDGRGRLVRGRIPGLLKSDLVEAATQMRVKRCTVVARRDEGGARLVVRGMTDFEAQRLKNVFRLYPLSALRAAPAPAKGAALRWLGIAWLVWLFDRSAE